MLKCMLEARKSTRSVPLCAELANRSLNVIFVQRLRPLSYAKAHVILIAFAIDTPDSLENVTVKVRTPFYEVRDEPC